MRRSNVRGTNNEGIIGKRHLTSKEQISSTHGGNLISVVCSLSGFTQPIGYVKFSLHEKWNNCLLPYRTVIA